MKRLPELKRLGLRLPGLKLPLECFELPSLFSFFLMVRVEVRVRRFTIFQADPCFSFLSPFTHFHVCEGRTNKAIY
jgi:hypothetical protein